MREVELNMTEDLKYNVIKKLVETNGNKKERHLSWAAPGALLIAWLKDIVKKEKPFSATAIKIVSQLISLMR